MIFSTPSVRALLAGHKTQTRRVIQPQPEMRGGAFYWGSPRYDNGLGAHYFHSEVIGLPLLKAWAKANPYGAVGDHLWVRELWRVSKKYDELPPRSLPHERGVTVMFQAGGSRAHDGSGAYVNDPGYPPAKPAWAGKLRAPMYLPRWASRLTLEIVDVRVERLQEISENDAKAEGPGQHPNWPREYYSSWRTAYRALWDEINGKKQTRNWAANPWVWVIDFKGAADYLLRQRINELAGRHGSLRAAARVLQVDHAYLWRLANGEKDNPDDGLLRKLGLHRVVTYKDSK